MLQFDRDNMQVPEIERHLIQAMYVVGGCAGIRMLVESVRILTFDLRQSRVVDIQRHGFLLFEDEGAQVIEATNMVLMFMSDEHRIQLGDVLAQHLLAEIGTGIHCHRQLIGLNQDGGAETFIARILRLAHRTGATDDRYTLRSSST